MLALRTALTQQADKATSVIYVSDQAHYCIQQAVDLVGGGRARVHVIPSDDAYRMRLDALATAIRADRRTGDVPAVVVGSLGTVDTGAIDPLPGMADVAEREDLWFHVDGAIGAPLACSPRLAPLTQGVERAHSVAFDVHKWMQVPFSVGGVLVRDAGALTRAFRANAAYVSHFHRGITARGPTFRDRSFDLSRPFTALKVWMTLRHVGRRAYGTLFEHSLALARHLATLIAADPAFELLAPVTLHTVCFRHVPDPSLDEAALEAHNTELLLRIQEDGTCLLTHTRLCGTFSLRACFSNHRTRRDDIDLAFDRIRALARPSH